MGIESVHQREKGIPWVLHRSLSTAGLDEYHRQDPKNSSSPERHHLHALTVHRVPMAWAGQKSLHRRQVMQRCILTGYTTPSTTPNTPMEHISRQIR